MAIGDRPALALGLVGGMMAASGKSGFLGALLAGFAAGYIILGLRKLCDKLPEALEKIAPVLIYPVVGILVMGLLMAFVVEPIMGGINTGLNNALTGMGSSSKVVLGIVLGGMMAIDMGTRSTKRPMYSEQLQLQLVTMILWQQLCIWSHWLWEQ